MQTDIVKNGTKYRPAWLRLLDTIDRTILRGWRVFTSLKFSIFLLALIGLVSIWGTMGFASNAALGDNAIPMARTLVFEHPYFVALLVLFAVNLSFATWHVTKMSFGIWWKRDFRRQTLYYQYGSSPRAEVTTGHSPEAIERLLRRHFTRTHREGNAFFAHKGLLSRIGPTIVHAGMLTVIGATVAKAVLLWNGGILTEGRFIAAEGDETNLIYEPQALEQLITDRNQRPIPLEVWIKVLDFDEVTFPNSETPAHYRSLVQVRDPRTQEVTVAQLDMNHSLSIETADYGRVQFHQAGYQPVPDGEFQRVNFDVRDRTTGERIAVTDAHPNTRVRVGETDLFLEVDGIAPANRWHLYHAAEPNQPVATGLLVARRELNFSFQPEEFYPDFRIDEEAGQPINASNMPHNPALRVALYLDDRKVSETWLFHDADLAALVPDPHPRFDLRLADVRIPPGIDLNSHDWSSPRAAIYDIVVTDKEAGEDSAVSLALAEQSRPFTYSSSVDHADLDLEGAGPYEVRLLEPTQRFMTVLSVVNEPTVPWTMAGVGIILLGAMMTFLSRYRAFYGLYDPDTQTLRMALVPRWGQSPVREELEALAAKLGSRTTENARQAEQAPAETPHPTLAKV